MIPCLTNYAVRSLDAVNDLRDLMYNKYCGDIVDHIIKDHQLQYCYKCGKYDTIRCKYCPRTVTINGKTAFYEDDLSDIACFKYNSRLSFEFGLLKERGEYPLYTALKDKGIKQWLIDHIHEETKNTDYSPVEGCLSYNKFDTVNTPLITRWSKTEKTQNILKWLPQYDICLINCKLDTRFSNTEDKFIIGLKEFNGVVINSDDVVIGELKGSITKRNRISLTYKKFREKSQYKSNYNIFDHERILKRLIEEQRANELPQYLQRSLG